MLAILIVGGVTFVITGVTPIERLAANQHRIRTSLAAVGGIAAFVVGGLLLNGADTARSAAIRNEVERGVDAWLEPFPGHDPVEVRIDGDTVTAVIIGPSEGAPGAAALADRLTTDLERETTATVRLVVEEARLGDRAQQTVTVPAVPSTSTVIPVVSRSVAPSTATTHGMPSSLDTITAWLISAPTFTTTAAAGRNSGVHAGSVRGATSTSPGWSPLASARVEHHPHRSLGRPLRPGVPGEHVARGGDRRPPGPARPPTARSSAPRPGR